jgi:hypothetical protein
MMLHRCYLVELLCHRDLLCQRLPDLRQGYKMVLLSLNNILMALYVGVMHVSQERNQVLFKKLYMTLSGSKLCRMNMMH